MHVTVTVIGTLGAAFAHAGHTVTFGVRAPAASPAPEGAPGTVTVRDIAAALADADVVVLAVPGPAVPDVVREHAAAFDGRLVIDATNTDGGAGPANSHAAVTAAAPGARYARAFNTLGVENLLDPRFAGQRADVFHTAPAVDRGTLAELIGAVGLRPVWLGEDAHDLVDGVLRLWLTLARSHGRHLAFRVLTDTGRV